MQPTTFTSVWSFPLRPRNYRFVCHTTLSHRAARCSKCCDHFDFFVWLWLRYHSRSMRGIICASQSLKSCCNHDNVTFVCVLVMCSHIWRTWFVGSGIHCSSSVLILALFYTHLTLTQKWKLRGFGYCTWPLPFWVLWHHSIVFYGSPPHSFFFATRSVSNSCQSHWANMHYVALLLIFALHVAATSAKFCLQSQRVDLGDSKISLLTLAY